MKNTDKITLTVGQLKRLISESKMNRKHFLKENEETEKVIIRREYDPFLKSWGFLVGYPEEEANPGRIAAQHIDLVNKSANDFGRVRFEPVGEVDINYFLNKKIVHKNDPDVERVKKELEKHYGWDFQVVEKINY